MAFDMNHNSDFTMPIMLLAKDEDAFRLFSRMMPRPLAKVCRFCELKRLPCLGSSKEVVEAQLENALRMPIPEQSIVVAKNESLVIDGYFSQVPGTSLMKLRNSDILKMAHFSLNKKATFVFTCGIMDAETEVYEVHQSQLRVKIIDNPQNMSDLTGRYKEILVYDEGKVLSEAPNPFSLETETIVKAFDSMKKQHDWTCID